MITIHKTDNYIITMSGRNLDKLGLCKKSKVSKNRFAPNIILKNRDEGKH